MKPELCWNINPCHSYNEAKANNMAFEMWTTNSWVSDYPVIGWPNDCHERQLNIDSSAEQLYAAAMAEIRIPVLYFEERPENYQSIEYLPISQYNQIWPQ